MDISLLPPALERCEGYCGLNMWEAAWEELETLPTELKQEVAVLTKRIEILMVLGEHRKASYIGLSLVQQFPEKLGILLTTAECLIGCKDHAGASQMLRNGLSRGPENAELWLSLARVEALLGNLDAAKECVKRYVTLNPEGRNTQLVGKPPSKRLEMI